jgi:hypothetical protein
MKGMCGGMPKAQRARYVLYQKFLLISAALVVISDRINAQATPQAGEGFTEATKLVSGYFGKGIILMYAIGAIVGVVGAIKVYNKWSNGDQDTGKVAASWFGSCIFLVVVATVLKGFFGVSE